MIPDYLATLASETLVTLWSPYTNVVMERRLWLTVAEAQRELGLGVITESDLEAGWRVVSKVDLASIRQRELRTRHDLKARLEEFADLAGHQHFHLGMTSADVVENTALWRMKLSLERLGLSAAFVPFRGIKGPVGTQQDQMDLLGSVEACDELDHEVATRLGFAQVANSVPQVMYRSIDLEVASAVVRLVAGIRHPLQAVLAGYVAMIVSYQGDTWNEGDVSSSVVRRVALPGLFFCADALLATRRG